tara:strand:+ start:725 stop:1252 length:528 start_codon:yes stop_codon:yes gene_type:complete
MNDKIIDKIHALKFQPYNLITYGLCLNAFALLTLLYGEFLLFVMLFATTIYTSKLFKQYKKKYNYEKKYIDMYYNVAEYIKILSTYAFFVTLYKSKLNNQVYLISIILLLLCNLNFTVETILEEKEKNIFVKTWIKLLSWIPKDKLKILYNFTQYFNEENILMYFVIIMVYVYYS